jgi:hypothetical protein
MTILVMPIGPVKTFDGAFDGARLRKPRES